MNWPLLFPYRIPRLMQRIFPAVRFYVPGQQKKVYLTFDDGPVEGVTDKVLDMLKKYDAKATFFCVGKNIEAAPDLYRRIWQEGHEIGNHTYGHCNGWKTTTGEYVAGVEGFMQISQRILPEKNIRFFRPPYGQMTWRQYQEIKKDFCPVLWDVLSGDYEPSAIAEKIVQRVVKSVQPGSIIVFHDSIKASASVLQAVPEVLQYFSQEGWSFCSLPDPDEGLPKNL